MAIHLGYIPPMINRQPKCKLTTDSKGRVIKCSMESEQVFGYEAQILKGVNFEELMAVHCKNYYTRHSQIGIMETLSKMNMGAVRFAMPHSYTTPKEYIKVITCRVRFIGNVSTEYQSCFSVTAWLSSPENRRRLINKYMEAYEGNETLRPENVFMDRYFASNSLCSSESYDFLNSSYFLPLNLDQRKPKDMTK